MENNLGIIDKPMVVSTEESFEILKIEDLDIKSRVTPAVYDFNFEELETTLNKLLKDYTSLVVTEDTLKGSRNAKSELASLRVRIENFRKETKKKGEAATKEFERRCNELKDLVIKAEKPLGESIDVFDEKKREEKRALANKCIKENVELFGLREKFANQMLIKPEYTNVNESLKAIREDVKKQAEYLKAKQDLEDKDIQTVKDIVIAENGNINIKIKDDSFVAMVENGSDINDVIKLIKEQAKNIFEQENKIIELEPDIAVAKPEPENLITTEATELVNMPAIEDDPVYNYFADETIPSDSILEHKATTIEESNKSSVPPYQPQPINQNESQAEQRFEVVFKLTGDFSQLRIVSDYLKSSGVDMEVLSQVFLQGEI